MKKHRHIFLLCTLLAFSMPFSASAKTTEYHTEVINEIGLGDVSIGLKEYTLDKDGDKIPYENRHAMLPGQRVDRMIYVENKANSAWVRIKLEYTSKDGIKGMGDQLMNVESDDWLPIGGYWYYRKPLAKGETVAFMDKMIIPPEWDESYSEKSFSVIVTAEAVQEQNFVPDFQSEDPWFGTVIETCVHTTYDTKNVGTQDFSIAFESGAEGLVKVGDDFFSNWGTLMPGDVVSDHVTQKNAYSRPVRMFFRTETVADDMLLQALKLQIKQAIPFCMMAPWTEQSKKMWRLRC